MKKILGSFLFPAWLYLFGSAETPVIQPITVTEPGNNVDSPAIWIAPNKRESLILLTEKKGGAVMVFRTDKKASFVRRFGALKRPNGVAVLQNTRIGGLAKDLAFVTDRDGNVVNVYSIPDFELVGSFGSEISQPMGISVWRDGDRVYAFIVPKQGEGDRKVVRFRISAERGRIVGVAEAWFGKELTVGQETVMVDAENRRVLVADENARDIKVYDPDGRFLKSFGSGTFQAQVEGIVVGRIAGRDVLIASDQLETTEFEIFDRKTYRHLGTVKGTARRTDGLALTVTPLPDFPHGLFLAQSDPEATGGRHLELYDPRQLLRAVKTR